MFRTTDFGVEIVVALQLDKLHNYCEIMQQGAVEWAFCSSLRCIICIVFCYVKFDCV